MTEGPAWRFVASQPWAITPEALDDVMAVAGRYNDDPEAVAAKLGRPLDNTREVKMRGGGVATIPVTGVIARYMNVFQQISGGTSIQSLATDLQECLENPAVKAIVLEIDSPGGQVAGVGEIANRIFAARGVKPVVAYVSNQGCSAAYYIASACERVVMAPSAMVGSIGTILTLDTRKRGRADHDRLGPVPEQARGPPPRRKAAASTRTSSTPWLRSLSRTSPGSAASPRKPSWRATGRVGCSWAGRRLTPVWPTRRATLRPWSNRSLPNPISATRFSRSTPARPVSPVKRSHPR
jgi:hypothetical protein